MSQVRNVVKVRYFGHEGQTPRRTTAASFESLRGLHPSAPPRQPRRFLTDCASMCTLVANLVARAHAIALSRFPGVGSAPAQWFSERLVESPRALTVSSPGSAGLSSLFPQGWQQMRPDHDVRHSGGRLGRSDRQLAGQADNGLPDDHASVQVEVADPQPANLAGPQSAPAGQQQRHPARFGQSIQIIGQLLSAGHFDLACPARDSEGGTGVHTSAPSGWR